MGSRLLRREHVVAASLVGAVVVVIGYASGFGVRPVIGSQAPAGGGGGVGGGGQQTRPPAVAQAPTTTTVPPAQPVGNGNRQVVPKAPLPAPPPAPVVPPPQHPHPTVPPPSSPPPTQPPPPCVPGLVPAALDTLLQTIGQATDVLGLPLLGLAPAPVATPLPPVDAAAPAEGPTAQGPTAQGPLDQLIGTCPPAVPPTQPPR